MILDLSHLGLLGLDSKKYDRKSVHCYPVYCDLIVSFVPVLGRNVESGL